jgi:hypothetical protein
MLIGLNTIKTVSREKAAVTNAWFDGEDEKPTQPTVQSAATLFAAVEIRASFKSVTRAQSAVPSLPRHAQGAKKAFSPYQAMSDVLDASSRSSRWIAQNGLAQQFSSTDCFVDMSMMADGGMSAVLRSPSGYRRTVVCRPDGTIAQRITGPRGEEIARFNNEGDAIYSLNKADLQLAIA